MFTFIIYGISICSLSLMRYVIPYDVEEIILITEIIACLTEGFSFFNKFKISSSSIFSKSNISVPIKLFTKVIFSSFFTCKALTLIFNKASTIPSSF